MWKTVKRSIDRKLALLGKRRTQFTASDKIVIPTSVMIVMCHMGNIIILMSLINYYL